MENILAKLEDIEKKNNKFHEDIKNMIIMENSMVAEFMNNIETKLDLFSNMEFNDNLKPASKTVKKTTPLMFLKQELKDDLLKFNDILYTKNNIDELSERDEVKAKKKQADKTTKIIALLYNEVIKKNSNANDKLKEMTEEFSQKKEIQLK